MTSIPSSQSQPPLHAEGNCPPPPPALPLDSQSQPTPDAIGPPSRAPSNNNGNHLPPARNQLSSGDNSESVTNFIKYGSIRPPVSVLQEEFLDKYRSWKEHSEPLEGIDAFSTKHNSGDVLTGHMASIRKLHDRNNNNSIIMAGTQQQLQSQFYNEGGTISDSFVFEPRSSSFSSLIMGMEESVPCKDEERVASNSDEDQDMHFIGENPISLDGDDDARKQLEKLVALMFRPGAKLSGTIEIPHEAAHSDYELLVLEGDVMDELGNPKGMLARHKFAGDEQCIFVKLSFVPVYYIGVEMPHDEEERELIEDKDNMSNEGKTADVDDDEENDENKLGRALPERKKLTVRIEYVDGDHLIQGLWNHDILCFKGTVNKLTEAQDESNQLGGTIINGLISGHSSFGVGDSRDEISQAAGGAVNISSRRSSLLPGTGTHTFLLSPCSHLHPSGIAPIPLWLALSESSSRMGLIPAQAETTTDRDVILGKEVGSPKHNKNKEVTPEKRKALIEEIASHDNYKLVLHRARTETLRHETLINLVELGSVIDFAELARKQNIAKRREKWRERLRKYTPRLPRRLWRPMGKTSSTAGGGNYNISKDNVQKKVQFYDHLATISWGDLLKEASVQAEKACAVFRRQAALLDNLTFESDEYKAQLMADLRRNGLTLASSHSEWDQCIQMGRTVALGWSWFERGSWSCFERSAVVGKRCVFLLFQMHSRLESNHKHLEKAFRGADARLTDMQLERIRKGSCAGLKSKSKEVEGVEDNEYYGLCGICQCDINEEGGNEQELNAAVRLPCSHSFHWECIREWLHNHSQCPICRVDLNA